MSKSGKSATRWFGIATAALCAAIAMRAHAQQAETITVTAARSDAASVDTTQLSGADIAASGAASIGDLLGQLPSFGAQGVNSADTDGGYGEYFADLRNLNFNRTLVLVDGKRFPLSGIQTDEAVDLNSFPAAFIDHVEVLRDGSQPQYAADAVAGVVNVVLKDQVEGLHLETYGGAASAGGDGTAEVSLIGGHAWSGAHLAIGLDALNRTPVLQSSRGWATDPIASATATSAGISEIFGSPATLGGHALGQGVNAVALGGLGTRADDPATDFYNPAGSHDLQAGLRRAAAYMDADADLTSALSADIELLFTDRSSTTLQPPQTLGLTGTEQFPDGFVIPADTGGNPFAVPVTLERVAGEAGPQQTTTSGPVWRVLGGLEGQQGAWAWAASFDRGQSYGQYSTTNEIDLARALQTAGALPCPASSGCVPADWFGPGSLSPQALSYIRYTGVSHSGYTETIGQANLDGPLLHLPAGPLNLAVGTELRRETGATTVDPVTARGDQAGPDAAPTAGGYNTFEAYATLDLPLLYNLPAIRKLDAQLAARETITSAYGTFPTLRAVITYQPAPGLAFHAISGTARRPPAIAEAFGGITAAAQPVADPCAAASGLRTNPIVTANCEAQHLGPGFVQNTPLVQVESGGNAHLHPEQSENETLGITYAPPFLPWLSGSVDWYHYRIRDAIDSLADSDPALIPDGCYESVGLSSPLCSLITRIAGGGNEGQISTILARDENVGTIKTDGVEFGLTARLKLPHGARLTLDAQANWLLDFRLHTLGQPGFVQYAGTFPGLSDGGSYARVRSRTTADLVWRDWSTRLTGRTISGARVLDAAPGTPFSKAPGVVYADIELSRRFGPLSAAVGVDNVLDTRPPTLVDGETNTSTSTYDVVGRLVWGRVGYVF